MRRPVERLRGRFDVLARGERIRVNVVRFAPGARNAWYVHVTAS